MNATRPTEGLLETPERVDLEVNYASVGSRALAQVIDMAILGVGWLVVGLGLAALRPALGSWSLVLIFGVSFLLFWFYFAAFEHLWQGQTPGKRALGLRVQKLGGYPIGWTEAFLRNLLRPVDALVGYAVGLISMLLTSRSQRIGDLVAGTVVVHESAAGTIRLDTIGYAAPRGERGPGAVPLGTREYEVLHEFLSRRDQLDAASARRIESKLASTLRERLARRGLMSAGLEDLSDGAFLARIDADQRGET